VLPQCVAVCDSFGDGVLWFRYDWDERNNSGTFGYTAFVLFTRDENLGHCVHWHRETFEVTSINVLCGVFDVRSH
jgi:hypothetical protein